MLENVKDAGYFLFNGDGEPVRFVIDDLWAKLSFRSTRRIAMTNPNMQEFEVLGEYLVKTVAGSPGLSRELSLKGFVAKYGMIAPRKVAFTEAKSSQAGRTFLEVCSQNFRGILPNLQ